MSTNIIANEVRSSSTHVFGRTLNSTRNHHFIVDGTTEPKEEVTPVEIFIAAVSSCAVQWIEKLAREDGVTLRHVDADIEAVRFSDQPNRFQHVDMHIEVQGATQEQAIRYVDGFKSRCPLYNTLAAATDVRFEVAGRT